VLATFRILGRGWTFDCAAEATFISEDVIRLFFHKFVKRYAAEIYPEVCKSPEPTDDATKEYMRAYTMAGLAGAFGSTDCTHVR
jgi:hypothetical protein